MCVTFGDQVCGESISPHVAAIFLVFIQFLGSMVTGVSVDIVGRRPLLIGSMFLMSANLFGFGLYCWILQGYSLDSLSPRPVGVSDNLDWIPLTLVLLFMFFFSVGIGPISWLMVCMNISLMPMYTSLFVSFVILLTIFSFRSGKCFRWRAGMNNSSKYQGYFKV